MKSIFLRSIVFLSWMGFTLPHFAFAEQKKYESSEQTFDGLRKAMVEIQLQARGIENPVVLEAMRKVKRHLFVPPELAQWAYEDGPLPIGYEQTISQPYIVAYMTETLELKPDDRVLEIGTGSGYQAAVLAEIVREVYTIEILPELAEQAAKRLQKLGYDNVHVKAGDGYKGWPEYAPFDAIIVTAAPETVPEALVEQLKMGGRLIVPVGRGYQTLLLLVKTEESLVEKRLLPVRFVPMVKSDTDPNRTA